MAKLLFRYSTKELSSGVRHALMKHKNLARVAMKAVRDTIVKAAVDRCPKDKGNLALSITGDVVENEKSWAATCYVASNEFTREYAVWIHEGEYNLGPNSLAKQASLPGIVVGPKYITRGIEDSKPEIIENLERCIKL